MGYTALYRQYRPRVFDQVMGQPHIVTTLKNQVSGNKIAHAYLFAGTRGTGKTSTARIFSRAVNCLKPRGGNPCNECIICEKALAGSLMDIIEIDAASNRGVDEIRDLREKVKYPPAEGRFRVYIVDEVHMLTTEAFNALLKTLEEPPCHIIFVLATTEPHRLPATVLSRCQRFDFKRISVVEITDLLKGIAKNINIDADDEALEYIAGRVDGSARDALSLLDKCYTYKEGRLTLDKVVSVLGTASEGLLFSLAEKLFLRDAAGCITLFNKAMGDGRDTGQFFKDIIHYLRDILVTNISPSGPIGMSETRGEGLRALAGKIEINTLIRWINVLAEAEAKAKWSPYSRVFLEVALIKLCEPAMDETYEGLVDRLSRLEGIVLEGRLSADIKPEQRIKDGDVLSGKSDRKEPVEETRERDLKGSGPKEYKNAKGMDGDGGKETIEAGPKGEIEEEEAEDSSKLKPDANVHSKAEKGLSLGEIIEDWDTVLQQVEKMKKGLHTIIKDSRPLEMNGTALVIGCDVLHGICYEIVNRKENKNALREAVFSVTGADVNIRIKDAGDKDEGGVPRSGEQAKESRGLYAEAVEIFGDELVEKL